MIDNFEAVKSMFNFNKANGMFFHCQIIRRQKDHLNEKGVREYALGWYLITEREELDFLKDEIIWKCEHYGARAYINVTGKDFDKLQLLLLKKIANYVAEGLALNTGRLVNKCAGELKSRTKLYLVDIDDLQLKESVLKWFDAYFELDPDLPFCCTREELYLKAVIPTLHGEHLLVSPFNREAFAKKFPSIDVHVNSMGTVLYVPNSVSQIKETKDAT